MSDHPAGEFSPETLALRAGVERSAFQEHSEALFLTSSFVFDDAAQAAARFANESPGYMYSRAGNPTVSAFQRRLAALEGAEAAVGAASGMAAIQAVLLGLCSAGDHIVAARELFGASVQLLGIVQRFGIQVSFVSLTRPEEWRAAVRPNTRVLFIESPSNPLTRVADIAALGRIAREADARLVVDNCFCSPALQRPLELGADLVVHSATKYLDGQGRVLGGAICGDEATVDGTLLPFLRTTGAVMSPFNAWVVLKGMETLPLRMRAHSENAARIAEWLQSHPSVHQVHYPGLASHPQHVLAARQQSRPGGLLSFEIRDPQGARARAAAWQVIDACRLASITANLGDVRTTITHPASTTHARVSVEERREAGVSEGLIRLAVGLEDPDDVMADLGRGLDALA